MLDIWKVAAPSLDIHVPGAKVPLADDDHAGNPLFVPEAQFRTDNLFRALGQHGAPDYSIFGIEDGSQWLRPVACWRIWRT
ncbi:hypothetical protein [Novosphingobium rosa]|uniref:hypothetical protein n=1 Tax=Novosphingobium rosa TaxID=76978 RepID=UPI0008373D90|nr:hypothetical protein [Novosphingobium rosa]